MARLPRLEIRVPIVDKDGRPTPQFQRLWQSLVEGQEATDAAQDATLELLNLVNSTPVGCSISAADVGSDATVTISGHTRYYGSGESVSVTGGTVTGQPFSTLLYVYYDDSTRAGGAVTYVATTSFATANPSEDFPNRHFVGNVTTPANGGAATTGDPSTPPTYGGGGAIP